MGMNVSIEGSNPSFSAGGVAERSNAAVSKTVTGGSVRRGFESLPLRFVEPFWLNGRRFPSFEHAEYETLAWIGFYNNERLHEERGDIPPAEYESNFNDQHRRFARVE